MEDQGVALEEDPGGEDNRPAPQDRIQALGMVFIHDHPLPVTRQDQEKLHWTQSARLRGLPSQIKTELTLKYLELPHIFQQVHHSLAQKISPQLATKLAVP